MVEKANAEPASSAPAVGFDQKPEWMPEQTFALQPHPQPETFAHQQFIVSMPGVSLVRYQPLVHQVEIQPSRHFRYYSAAVGVAVVVALCCLFQIASSLSAIKTAETARSDSIQTLATIIKEENQRLADARNELSQLSRPVAQTIGSRTSVLVPVSQEHEEQQWKEQLARLEHLFLTRSLVAEAKAQALTGNSPASAPALENQAPQSGYNFDASIAPVAGAVVHRSPAGQADYWLVPKPGAASPVRVIPFATTQLGAAVHNLDDGHDYIITLLGEWMKYGI